MPKVLILGAGASYGHGINGASRPPLANGFFNAQISISLMKQFGVLLDYISQTLKLDLVNSPSIDIEELFARLESGWKLAGYDFEEKRSGFGIAIASLSPINMLCSYVVDAVYSSTRWLTTQTCPLHFKIVNHWLSPGDTVISFNYDLIIDQTLKQTGRWAEFSGYGMSENDSTSDTEILLLKPHGSLNWFLEKQMNSPFQQGRLGQDNHPVLEDPELGKTIRVLSLEKALDGKRPDNDKQEAIVGVGHRMVASLKDAESRGDTQQIEAHMGLIKGIQELEDPWLSAVGMLPLLVFPTPYKSLDKMMVEGLRYVWRHARRRLAE